MKRLLYVFILAGLMITDASLYAQRGAPKNLQVIEGKSGKELRDFMKSNIASGIGEKCNFCHNMKDYASDENKNKQVAREMMKMVNEINTQVAAINRSTMKKSKPQTVTCYTCHAGSLEVANVEEE